jgi:hypothetical protein
LFRRTAARFSDDLVHEKVVAQGPEGQLRRSCCTKVSAASKPSSTRPTAIPRPVRKACYNKGRTASVGKAIGHGLWAFIRTYFLRLGFLDGRMGLVLAISNAEGTYYRYLKLWLLRRDGQGSAGRAMKISFVVLTYNRTDALLAVLRSLAAQCGERHEVLVADDGSRPDQVQMLFDQCPAFRCPARHVWHPDVGFTAARARNLGASQATGDYLVFLDGDCVPNKAFVARKRGLPKKAVS